MKYHFSFIFILFSFSIQAQMLNDSPFNANVAHPAFKKNRGKQILIDKGHHNFIIELGLIQPFMNVAKSDGYNPIVDSSVFTKAYLSKYSMLLIMPALPFEFGSKSQVTNEVTFTFEEIENIYNWVNEGGSLMLFSEHAPIDKAMTPLFNRFGIELSIGVAYDSLNCDTTVKKGSYDTVLEFNKKNGLLNSNHPITKGDKPNEQINQLRTWGGSALKGEDYTPILKLSNSAGLRKYSGTGPSNMGNALCLVGHIGKGKLFAMGDCNGFTAMYGMSGGRKVSAGMQVQNYDWKQFVLNTLHWLD